MEASISALKSDEEYLEGHKTDSGILYRKKRNADKPCLREF